MSAVLMAEQNKIAIDDYDLEMRVGELDNDYSNNPNGLTSLGAPSNPVGERFHDKFSNCYDGPALGETALGAPPSLAAEQLNEKLCNNHAPTESVGIPPAAVVDDHLLESHSNNPKVTAAPEDDRKSAGEDNVFLRTDRYGFLEDDKRWVDEAMDPKQKKKNVKKERDRTTKWIKMLKHWDRYVYQKPEKLKKRIRKGIPDAMRGTVWPLLINSAFWKDKYPNLLNIERAVSVPYSVREDIIKDLNRTFPRHELFTCGVGQESLERILVSYAAHDPVTGYCQGMGFIAGMFLMYMDEETAFYSLLGVLENPQHPMRLYFMPKFAEVKQIMHVYSSLGRRYLPRLWAHLDEENLHESMYAIEWFMTVYTRSFRFDFVTRIWDVMLNEGKKIIFRVALGLMKSIEKELMDASFEKMMVILRELPFTANTERVMEIMWHIPLKRADITRLEQEYTVANLI